MERLSKVTRDFEIPECSRDKGKYKFMGDLMHAGKHTRSASLKRDQPTIIVGKGKRNHARSAPGRQARECHEECKI